MPSWLTVVLLSLNFSAHLTYPHPHRDGPWAATIFLYDSIFWPNSLSRDLGLKHSQGVSAHGWN